MTQLDPKTRNRLRGLRDALDAYERTGDPIYRHHAETVFSKFMEAATAGELASREAQNARTADRLAAVEALGGTFIIEHPTRGVLKFFVSPEEFGFSTTGQRNDPDKTRQFFSHGEAKRILDKLPDRVRRQCRIRSSAKNWEVVE